MFNINITYDNVFEIFNKELTSIKYKIIKECIKFMIEEDIINSDEFDATEKDLINKFKKK